MGIFADTMAYQGLQFIFLMSKVPLVIFGKCLPVLLIKIKEALVGMQSPRLARLSWQCLGI